MSDYTAGAILQRDKASWAVKPRTPLGMLSPADLERIGRVASKHGVRDIKMTSAQRFILLGVPDENLAALREELGPLGELCKNYVQSCPGIQHCQFGVRDSLAMGLRLEKLVFGKQYPAKVKVGVSACPFSCGESLVRDVGLVGKSTGWWMYVGGNSAGMPRVGDLLAKNLSDDAALDLVERFFAYYTAMAQPGTRTARFMEQTDLISVREALNLENF